MRKFFKYPRLEACRDARPLIGHADANMGGVRLAAMQSDLTSFRGVFDRVRKEVGQNLLQAQTVDPYLHVERVTQYAVHPKMCGEGLVAGHRLIQQLA